MLRQSIQKIKAMLSGIEYGILFVDTVDTKIKASNAFNAMFVDTVDTGVCGSYTAPYAEYYVLNIGSIRIYILMTGRLEVVPNETNLRCTYVHLKNLF